MKKLCKHVWIYYVSVKKRQCLDCKRVEKIEDEARQVEHIRKSGIGQ